MTEARLPERSGGPPPTLIAMGEAADQLAMLRMWLVGEASCSAEAFAEHLHRTGQTDVAFPRDA